MSSENLLMNRLKNLNPSLHELIAQWCELAKEKLRLIERNFPHETSHGVEHCEGMLAALNWLIPSDTLEKLNPLEIALLVLAVFHHDIGMAWDVERKTKLMESDPDWLAEKDVLIDKFRRSKTVNDKSDQSLLNLAFIEWARKRHAEEAEHWIKNNRIGKPEFRLSYYFNYDPWEDVKELSRLHTESTFDELPIAKPIGPGGILINLCFLECCLRLADACHVTLDRADEEVEKYIRFTDEYRREKWKVRQRIKGVGPGDRVIVINATPDSPALHRAIATIGREIKSELDKINLTLSKKKSALQFPWINVDFETQVKESDSYKYRDWEFALNRSRVYELLMGDKLYADMSVCIRELLQNAVDAIWARFGSEAPTKGKIICRRYEKQRDDQNFEVIEVEDNGIGMDEEIIENHLLRVPGESFYQTGRFKREHPKAASIMIPIAQHGIGFLSNFMVAGIVEIFTRYDSPVKPSDPIHVELISLDKGVVYYKPVMENFPEELRSSSGTCVRLWLTKKLTDWACSHRKDNWKNLKEVVEYWARRITIPLVVEEFGQTFSVSRDFTIPFNAFPVGSLEDGINGYIDLSIDYSSPEAKDLQVTVSGFYVERSPLRKELFGLWFPRGEIDFYGKRDFSLTVNRSDFAEYEGSKTIKKAKSLLVEATIKWIRKQRSWDKKALTKLRRLLLKSSVLDEYDDLRKEIMELPIFRVGTTMQNESIKKILEKPAYFYLPIWPIFRKDIMNYCKPARYFSTWYGSVIKELRSRYPIMHGTEMGQTQPREYNLRFAARSRYRQTYPLHLLIKLCNAKLEFTDEGWPLVKLLPLKDLSPTSGWNWLLDYEPNKKDWLICSTDGEGYWINPYCPRKQSIINNEERIVGVYIKRFHSRRLVSRIADGFLYPKDIVTIVVESNGKYEHREFTIAQLGDLVYPFDRIDFWVDHFCREANLTGWDRAKLLQALYLQSM